MNRKIYSIIIALVLGLALVACESPGYITPGDVGTVTGGVAGGVIGNSVGNGNAAATIGGTLGGAFIGNQIGRQYEYSRPYNDGPYYYNRYYRDYDWY